MLYDNQQDPYQLTNLVGDKAHLAIQADLDSRLRRRLSRMGDEFRPGMDYINRWGYVVDDTKTMSYTQ